MKEMSDEEDYFKHENTVIKFWSHLLKYESSDLSFIHSSFPMCTILKYYRVLSKFPAVSQFEIDIS